MEITISQTTISPTQNYLGTVPVLRGWYSKRYVAGDAVTPVESGNGLTGFYYSIPCSVNGDGEIVIPAFTIQSTTDGNLPTARFTGQLFDQSGAPREIIFGNPTSGNGWQIPTLYGANVDFADLFRYNAAAVLLNPPPAYLTQAQVIAEILALAGQFDYARVGHNGIGQPDVAPASASAPIWVGVNSPLVPSFVLHTSKYASLNAAITALTALGGGTIVVDAATPVTSNVATTALMELKFEGQGMLTGTAKTVTIVGPLAAPVKQLWQSGVTVLFTDNPTIWGVYGEYWGGGNGVAASTNTAAFQAASDALCSIAGSSIVRGSGYILFGGGQYDFNDTWTIGKTTGGPPFTGISLRGTNGLVGTTLNWTGATNKTFIKYYRGRYMHIDSVMLNNANNVYGTTTGRGTTIGIQFTGTPAGGEQTSNVIMSLCQVRGFDVGAQSGDIGDTAAGELTFLNTIFESNNNGYLGASSGNSVVIRFVNCSGYANATAINIGAGSGDTHIAGGGFSGNTTSDISLSLGWNGTVDIQDARFEIAAAHTGSILNFGNTGVLRIGNCRWATTDTVPTWEIVRNVTFLRMDSCSVGNDSENGWKVAGGLSGAAAGNLSFTNNRIQNTTAAGLFTLEAPSGQVGMRYQSEGNFYTNAGIITRYDNVVAGMVGLDDLGSALRIAQSKVVSGVLTGDVLTFGDQITTPTVAYGGGNVSYKTADSGATLQTDMLGSQDGQIVPIFFTNGNRTIVNNANQKLAGAVNFVGTTSDILVLKRISGVWYEVSRSLN